MKQDYTVSIALSIFNQEPIIEYVLRGLLDNVSDKVKEFVICFDGCTDNTEKITREVMGNWPLSIKYLYADNVFETKANNLCFKQCTGDYIFTLQDDMVVQETNCDKRLIKPFAMVNNVIGVTARNAQNERYVTTNEFFLECYNVAGKDVNSPRNLFAVRSAIVRGPIMFNHVLLEDMNYLDETFAPFDCDDKDLSYRAWRKGYKVGFYGMEYRSDMAWGKTRNNYESSLAIEASQRKNYPILLSRHMDLIKGEQHDEDIFIN